MPNARVNTVWKRSLCALCGPILCFFRWRASRTRACKAVLPKDCAHLRDLVRLATRVV